MSLTPPLILPRFKEVISEISTLDGININALAASIVDCNEYSSDSIALKQALGNIQKILEIVSQGGVSQMNTSPDIGVANGCDVTDKSVAITADPLPTTSHGSASSDELLPLVDPQFVFLARNKVEIDERIAKYIETKQNDNNEINIREFCGLQPSDSAESETCARTSSVFQPRSGHSHLIVQKVVNRCGPQVKIKASRRLRRSSTPERRVQPKVESVLPPSVEERLTNMELHINVHNGKPIPRDVYDRLRILENRITYLESVSPEYFDHAKTVSNDMLKKKPKIEPFEVSTEDIRRFKGLSANEVDRKITQLKLQLTRRARELQTLQTK